MPRKRSGREQFRQGVRTDVRTLWSGEGDAKRFDSDMRRSLDRGYTMAWLEGAGDYGITQFEDLTTKEQIALGKAIADAIEYIDGFSDAIQAGSKANKGKLAPLLKRAELWVNRYDGIVSLARTMAGADQPMQWVLGPTEQHCRDCSALNGKVKRGSVWRASGILPQVPELECHGFNCLCQLVPTTAPISKGKLPRLHG